MAERRNDVDRMQANEGVRDRNLAELQRDLESTETSTVMERIYQGFAYLLGGQQALGPQGPAQAPVTRQDVATLRKMLTMNPETASMAQGVSDQELGQMLTADPQMASMVKQLGPMIASGQVPRCPPQMTPGSKDLATESGSGTSVSR